MLEQTLTDVHTEGHKVDAPIHVNRSNHLDLHTEYFLSGGAKKRASFFCMLCYHAPQVGPKLLPTRPCGLQVRAIEVTKRRPKNFFFEFTSSSFFFLHHPQVVDSGSGVSLPTSFRRTPEHSLHHTSILPYTSDPLYIMPTHMPGATVCQVAPNFSSIVDPGMNLRVSHVCFRFAHLVHVYLPHKSPQCFCVSPGAISSRSCPILKLRMEARRILKSARIRPFSTA